MLWDRVEETHRKTASGALSSAWSVKGLVSRAMGWHRERTCGDLPDGSRTGEVLEW